MHINYLAFESTRKRNYYKNKLPKIIFLLQKRKYATYEFQTTVRSSFKQNKRKREENIILN